MAAISIQCRLLILGLGSFFVVGYALLTVSTLHITSGVVDTDPSPRFLEYAATPTYNDDLIDVGIPSRKPPIFFRQLQDEVDRADPWLRCRRYGWSYNPENDSVPSSQHKDDLFRRRIFLGSLIADEPWEVVEIIATEIHSVLAGAVFIESNRTQNFDIRPWTRQHARHVEKLQRLLGTRVEIRAHVQENQPPPMHPLIRESRQRQAILQGWKDLGMGPDDIGYISDLDETFSRDFLRAVQSCHGIGMLDYQQHQCFAKVGHRKSARIIGVSRVFETSPECITHKREWLYPDLVLGACLEGIGDETRHGLPNRENVIRRRPGYGKECNFSAYDPYGPFPLWNTADFRYMKCGDYAVADHDKFQQFNHSPFTGFHFHNFFGTDFSRLRFKYQTYGHPDAQADRKPLSEIHRDLTLFVNCVQNLTRDIPHNDEFPPWKWKSFSSLLKQPGHVPLYFLDAHYRAIRHAAMREAVAVDEKRRQQQLQNLTTS